MSIFKVRRLNKGILFLITVLLLSGCVPAVVMTANIAGAEAFSSSINPETEIPGTQVFYMGDWDKVTERTTYSIFGIDDWICAHDSSGGGGWVCVPSKENIKEINNSQVYFSCEIGQGGMVSQLVSKKNATTFFCKKVSAGNYVTSEGAGEAQPEVPKDKEQLVRDVQTMLSKKGYNPGPIDGQDGPSTKSALREFQNKQGLPLTAGVTEDAYIQLASGNKNTHSTNDARECVRNFKKESGGLRSYSTKVMLDGVPPELAKKRLVRALARDGFTLGGDNSQGIVTGTFDAGSSSLILSAFFDKIGQGSQVELHFGAQKVSLGMMSMSEDVYRGDLCEFVDAMRGG